MRILIAAAAMMVGLAMAATAAAFDRGPAIGAPGPSLLQVQDQTGAPRAFDNLVGENGMVLVFNRSVDWCPVCQRQTLGLEAVRADIEEAGYSLVIVTTDTPEELARFAARRSVGATFLADPDFAVIDAYNLRDPAFPPGHRIHGVPVPSIFFLDAGGVVQAKLGDDDYRVRPQPSVVLETLAHVN